MTNGETNWKTAAELMAELQADPAFRRRQRERKQRLNALEQDVARSEAPVVAELHNAGFPVQSLDTLAAQYAPLPNEIVQILLHWVGQATDPKMAEWLIRPLAAAKEPFDGRPLVDCFQQTSDEHVRWIIANTIATGRPYGIDAWLATQMRDPYWNETFRKLGLEDSGPA